MFVFLVTDVCQVYMQILFCSNCCFVSFCCCRCSYVLFHFSSVLVHFLYRCVEYEPQQDKINKMTCAPSEDSDQPGHPPSLIRVFAVRMKKPWVLIDPLSVQRRLWSDWADAQADLSLRWAHGSFLLVLSLWRLSYVCLSDIRLSLFYVFYMCRIYLFLLAIRLVVRKSRVQSSGPAPSFIEVWSWSNFYGHSLPTADSNKAVVSYWWKYGHLVLVNRFLKGSLPRISVDRLTDRLQTKLDMHTCTSQHSNKTGHVQANIQTKLDTDTCTCANIHSKTFIYLQQNWTYTHVQAYVQTNLNMYTCKQTFQNIHLSATKLDKQTCTSKHSELIGKKQNKKNNWTCNMY